MKLNIKKISNLATKDFFVRDHYKNEIHLFGVELKGRTFYYHHLENFFALKLHQVESEITKLFDLGISPYPCLSFFKESIESYFASMDQKQKSIELMGLTNLDSFRAQNSAYKTYKIKIHKNSLSEAELFELRNYSGKFIFDANQSLSVTEFQKIFDQILANDLMDKVSYFEEPIKSADLISISKDLLSKIALDETLFTQKETIVEKIFDHLSCLVVKPSMIDLAKREFFYHSGKNITLSSSYEHPSLYHGFFKEALKVKNNIHGLATFDIHPDFGNNYFNFSNSSITLN